MVSNDRIFSNGPALKGFLLNPLTDLTSPTRTE
jgi:hypothetical protein